MNSTAPENIGHFKLLSRLGQGGMGSVYRAMHGTLARPVALKLLSPEFSSHSEYIHRFLLEARTIAAIRHENIIHVYDSGEIKGQYYIAMELVDGGNLLAVADARQKMSEDEGLRLMLQAARGLGAAHAKGLIHRDIKPENMLLGSDGVLRIVDFGLVMDSGAAMNLTQAGTCLGTPMYMSPEQADGETADPRSDLYSLGASFYRVFTGRPPFISATVMNVLFKQKFERPPDPQSLRPDLSRGASDLLLHLLAKRREHRPNDAQALMAMIEDVLAGRAIPPPPVFAPLIPKGQHEIAEPSVSADGETAVLFGSGPRRTSSSGGSRGQSTLVAAALVAVLCAAAIWAIASGTHHEPTAAQPSNTAGGIAGENKKPPAPLTPAEIHERILAGDAEFKAGHVPDARAIYLEALSRAPGNVELITRRDRADRRIKFDLDMQAAEDFENKGQYEDALVRYAEADALDEDNIAQERIKRVKGAMEKATKPLAEFSPAPVQPAELKALQELDQATKIASDALLAKDYERAEKAYLRAADLSNDSRRISFTEKARQCKRLKLLDDAQDFESRNELAQAESTYLKAQELGQDAETSQRLDALRQKIKPPEDKSDATYQEAMRDGQSALEGGDFNKARVKFGIAMGLKPELSPPASKLNEVDGRELFQKGDAARDAGDLNAARQFYQDALVKCASLEAEAHPRIDALQRAPSRGALAIEKACALVKDRKLDDASAVLENALKLDAGSSDLENAKGAFDKARNAAELWDKMQESVGGTLAIFKEAAALDEDPAIAKRQKELQEQQKGFEQPPQAPLQAFAARDFAGAQAAANAIERRATYMKEELRAEAEFMTKLAEKADDKVGLKVPFIPKIGVGGDKKKAEKIRALAASLKELAVKIQSGRH